MVSALCKSRIQVKKVCHFDVPFLCLYVLPVGYAFLLLGGATFFMKILVMLASIVFVGLIIIRLRGEGTELERN